ncbi:MAG: hypothetical protein KGK09_00645, partial [Burkholderiales bacterium]|nr:hypothetical protein [Burkholderiales bacterium]
MSSDLRCPACRGTNPPSRLRCSACGIPLRDPQPPSPRPGPPPAANPSGALWLDDLQWPVLEGTSRPATPAMPDAPAAADGGAESTQPLQ